MKSLISIVSALAAFALAGTASAQQASGQSGVRLFLGGSEGAPAARMTTEHGVRIYRGARSEADAIDRALDGAGPPPATQTTKIIVIDRGYEPATRVRTQGFYSGQPRTGRRYTQGFYSGPAGEDRPIVIRMRN